MSSSLSSPKQPRVFVSYHHGNDQGYYDAFVRGFCDTYEIIQDRSLDRAVDSDNAEYVIRRIRENYITGTSCTILLCGAETPGRKYIDWEIKATLDKQHGLVGVLLPTARHGTSGIIVPDRYFDNYVSGYAPWITWAKITESPQSCAAVITDANTRSKTLIDNSRSLRKRNS